MPGFRHCTIIIALVWSLTPDAVAQSQPYEPRAAPQLAPAFTPSRKSPKSLRYSRGQLAPPGYTYQERTRYALSIPGAIVFSMAYGVTAIVGTDEELPLTVEGQPLSGREGVDKNFRSGRKIGLSRPRPGRRLQLAAVNWYGER